MFKTEIREALRAAHDRPQRRRGTSQHSPSAQDDSRDGATADDGGAADTATKPIRCAFLLPPSAKPETWWRAIVLGRENDVVASQDAVLALAHVAYRLGYARFDVGLSHNDMTVEGLHTTIEEHYGGPGWTALMECWHEAAGIAQFARSHADIPKRIPEPDSPSPFSPSLESEARALARLPSAVRRFWLREAPITPAWRHRETAGEKELRERMEADGSWCG
jgi:hypothetical protein